MAKALGSHIAATPLLPRDSSMLIAARAK